MSTMLNDGSEPFDEDRLCDQMARKDEMLLQNEADTQQREIEDEIKQTHPLLSDVAPISTLIAEYNEKDSATFLTKAKDLAISYVSIRRVRGDGNCFYRAVLFAQLELLFTDVNERTRFTTIAKGWRERLFKLGFPEMTTSDFCDWFVDLLDDIETGKKDIKQVFEAMNDEGASNYYVVFFRLITSGYLKENAINYEGFIDGDRSVDSFCRDEVEPMWRDADHLCIMALVQAIDARIRIEYMDRTAAPDGGWHHDFGGDESRPILMFFLYRPGHYDILYRQ